MLDSEGYGRSRDQLIGDSLCLHRAIKFAPLGKGCCTQYESVALEFCVWSDYSGKLSLFCCFNSISEATSSRRIGIWRNGPPFHLETSRQPIFIAAWVWGSTRELIIVGGGESP